MPLNPTSLITDRARAIDASGIRRVFDLAAELEDPINLSIGQPDFQVPEPVKQAAIDAITQGQNSYTQTQGIAALRDKVCAQLQAEFPATYGQPGSAFPEELAVLITSGVSGGLMLALLATVQPGDEVIVPDPYFVMYKHLVSLAGGTAVFADTYDDGFQLTAERVESLLTPSTKMVITNSPSNPTGVVADAAHCEQLARLCDERGVLLLSDEIYDTFCYDGKSPSPVLHNADTLLLRGYSKSYAMTGWRLGYAVGPRTLLNEMTKLQQYTFVCAPSMVQVAGVAAMDVDLSAYVAAYTQKRDRVVEVLGEAFELASPGGAFYAYVKVPERLGLTATKFVEQAIAQNVLVIPGSVFSQRDTHFRLSYACDDAKLEAGLQALVRLAKG